MSLVPSPFWGVTLQWSGALLWAIKCTVLLRASLRPDLESMAAACSAEST